MRILTAAAVVMVLLAGCNRGAQDAGEPAAAPTTAAPSETAAAPTEAPTEAAPTATASPRSVAGPTVELYFVRESGNEIFVEPQPHRVGGASVAIARAAIEALLTTAPSDPALTTLIPAGTELIDIVLKERLLTIDLALPGDGIPLGGRAEARAYEQIVQTGAQFASVRQVKILDDGETPQSGHLDLAEPLRPDAFAVSPVTVTSPAHGEQVDAGDVTFTGTANTYEANVGLELVDPDGETVEQTFTTATCGTGCRGDWEHTFSDVTTPGTWTLIASEDDASDGEGPPPFRIEREFTVR